MKNNLRHLAFLFVVTILFSSCAAMREKRAENNQPFKPHQNKKPHQGHPDSQQHHK